MEINKILLFVLSMMMIAGNGLTTFGSAGNETDQNELNMLGIDIEQHMVGESEMNCNEADQNEPNMLGIDIEQHMVGESEMNSIEENRIHKIISSAEELLDLSIKWNEGEIDQGIAIELENDITVPEGINWVPIGCEEHEFKGTFDGHNHKILGILCEGKTKDNIGLFGVVGKEGIVKNVTIENSKFEGKDRIGGICGINEGTILNCNNRCTVIGNECVGGNVGFNEGKVEGVKNLAGSSVGGHHAVGGNVGFNEKGGTVKGSKNGSNITGKGVDSNQIGGNVGFNEGKVEGVKNLVGSSVGGHHAVGGNVGRNREWGIVTGSENGGNITGEGVDSNQIGGNVGRNEGIVEGVRNLGSSMEGHHAVGGNVGGNVGTVKGSENKGNIAGEGEKNQQIGGNVGRNEGIVEGVRNLGSSVRGHHAVGGNVGCNLVTVTGSENGGNITGVGENNQQIGGNVGRNEGIEEGVKNLVGSSVKGNWAVGGNVGYNKEVGIIKGSENGGNITGEGEKNQQVGGNVGRNEGKVEGVKNLVGSSVGGHHGVGGNVGCNFGTVKVSENGGNITGEGNNSNSVGGNVGRNEGKVEGVKNLVGSSVKGFKIIGGNVGCNKEGGTVKGSENGGNITGVGYKNKQIGGNVGWNRGTVEKVRNLAVSSVTGNAMVGRNVGCNQGTVKAEVVQ